MAREKRVRKYVPVIVRFEEDGKLRPLEIEYEDADGKKRFIIDQVLDIRRAACQSAGGTGDRYTIRIKNQQTYLWLEEGRWFISAKCQV